MSAPLQGLTVVSLEQAVAAPLATRHLADLGARVIKVERPTTGDFARHYDSTVLGQSSHFVWLNRSKESLTLDLKHPKAKELLLRLIDGADVFVQNLAPGAAARLGLGGKTLLERNPRLVACSISGFGSSGPYRDRKAYDLLIQCEAGLLSVTGTQEAPSKAGIAVADIAAGIYAFSGILTALYRRERTGQGGIMEVSMLEALGEWMGFPAYYTAYGGTPPARSGGDHASIAPYGPHATGEGETVFLAVQNDREWQRLCSEVIGRPEIASDHRFVTNEDRVVHRAVLRQMLEDVFRGWTSEETIGRLDAAGIACARMNTAEGFWNHPQLAARGRWTTVDSPGGAVRALLPPVSIEGVEAVMGPIPAVGEHTKDILRGLGVGEEEIRYLARDRAI